MDVIQYGIIIGVGATLIMDLWALFLNRFFGIQSLDYKMVGRWIGHLSKGKFVHSGIGKSEKIKGEAILGWGSHYLIGIVFAFLLLTITGSNWAISPTFGTAIVFGIVTVVAPFFILQPGLGAGVAASKTPNPTVARIKSISAHASYGIGLYLSAIALQHLF